MNRFSLRTRLVVLAAVLVAFAVTLVGAATYTLLSSYLYHQLDSRLVQTANDSARAAGSILTGGGPGPTGYRIDRDTCAVLVDSDKVRTLLQPGDDPATLDLDTARSVLSDGGPITVTATTGESVRAIPVSVTIPDGTTYQLVVTLPTSGVTDTLRRLLALELVIGGAAVLAVGVLGAVGVRFGLRPLDRVTRTARTVAAELGPDGSGLDNRVPGADPRTEVGQLAEAVNTMLGAVEREYTARYESEQRLRRFLADASHELRTPLTSLRGYAELVRMRGGLDPEASDSLRRIEAEGTRMGGLVDDLLTLARSDRGLVAERVPVDVAEVVDDAVAGLSAAYPHRQVSVTARGPLLVLGDRDQLLQVVTNILTNAAVHATAPVPITVSAAQEGADVVVRVVDGGPGLPPDQAAQVFDRFWRADAARTRVRGGSGLGLSIVAALVADHGGRVAFDSDVAAGTTVTVHLPAAPLPTETLSSERTPAQPVPAPPAR
jgi:two-component system, OmpR family, sensor kinase